MAENNTSKHAPGRSEKYLLGEKMVVEFLGKPYQLGVSNTPPRVNKPAANLPDVEE
jgi:hypothetical protein